MTFLQIMEVETDDFEGLERLHEQWLAESDGQRTVTREWVTRDRDDPNRYVMIVEFPSYEAAMRNNDLPATARIAEGMARLATSPPQFRNLDLVRADEL
jgi:quinol monooxygenase YgiN